MKKAFSKKNLWAATPPAVKRVLAPLISLARPEFYLGRRFRQELAFVREAQFWPAERARAYQLARLRETCLLAATTPYYRKLFQDAGFAPGDLKRPEDLQLLPTMDKSTVVANLAEMCAVPPDGAGVDYVATGGSSGAPLRFYAPASRSSVEYAYLVAGWERAGYRLGTPLAVLRGRPVAVDGSGLHHEYDPLLRHHFYSNFHTTDADLLRYVEHIRTLGPCFLHVYPSSVTRLATALRQSGVACPDNVRGILAGSEMVYAEDRTMVEETISPNYHAWYGHSEKLVLAAECEHSSDYHVWPTYGYFELLGEDGQAVTTPGERGEIVGTGFINTVTPFIRYRTGDWAVYGGEKCAACGREQTLLRQVLGRWPQGGLEARDGSVISMTTANLHDDTFEQVADYQFRQLEAGRAELCIIQARPLSLEERAELGRRVEQALQGQVSIAVRAVDELEKTPAGKQLRVVHERKRRN